MAFISNFKCCLSRINVSIEKTKTFYVANLIQERLQFPLKIMKEQREHFCKTKHQLNRNIFIAPNVPDHMVGVFPSWIS